MAMALKKVWWQHRSVQAFGLSLCAAAAVFLSLNYMNPQTSDQPRLFTYATDPLQADETPTSQNEIDSYEAAPDAPETLRIGSIGVKARVLPMAVGADGAIQTPSRIADAGWYTGASKPGDAGAVFIDGHVSGPNKPGIFKRLTELKKDDSIELEVGDNTQYVYEVVATEKVSYKNVDMQKALRPYNGATRGLNIITCTGIYDKGAKTFTERFIVYAVLTQPVESGAIDL